MALSAETRTPSLPAPQEGTRSAVPALTSSDATMWLNWLSEMLPAKSWFALYSTDGARVVAKLPESHDLAVTLPVFAKQAAERGEPCQCPLSGEGNDALALPLRDANGGSYVLIFDSQKLDIKQKQSTVRLILWASRWLGLATLAKTTAISDLTGLQHKLIFDFDRRDSIDSAAMALVNELADVQGVFRTSVAEFTGDKLRLLAVSGLSKVDSRRASAQLILNAMREVKQGSTDSCRTTSFITSTQTTKLTAHQQLVQSTRQGSVHGLSYHQPEGRGGVVLLIEQEKAAKMLDINALQDELEPSLALLGVMHRAKRSVPRRLRDETQSLIASIRENRFLDKHLLVFVCSILAITAMLLPVPHRVTARASIEASDRQVLVAPQEGYVLSSHARAGDTVQEGELLATLDGRDLQLVEDKWQGELRAPFDGVLLSGDLSQALGSPVEEGQVLFEIGSKDAYRLQMNIDEHDIAYIQQGQAAKIRMTALPGVTWDATLENVMPVAVAEQGESTFRVPASIIGKADTLRPGMAGVGKISVGSRSLIWVMTHAVTDRVRIWAWKLGLIK